MTTIKTRCAWCGKDIGEKDGEGKEGDSHGICPDCLLHHFPDVYQRLFGDKELSTTLHKKPQNRIWDALGRLFNISTLRRTKCQK